MNTPQQAVTSTEPAAVAEAVRVILAALIAAGWLTLPDTTVAAIVSLVGVAASIVLTWWTRRRVVPVANTTGTPPT